MIYCSWSKFQNLSLISGNVKNIVAPSCYYQILVLIVGILGAGEILATFACVMYMPVSSPVVWNFWESFQIFMITYWYTYNSF